MTKAQQIRERVDALVTAGSSKSEAFAQVATEFGIKPASVRGAYSTASRDTGQPGTRTRRRETTPDDALADARAALERAIASIDREVELAQVRATEARAEADSLKGSAAERKAAITKRLEALR